MMRKYKKLKENMRANYWTYFEPSWWNLRWRGGSFVMIRPTEKTKDENGVHYLQCLDELSEADGGEGFVHWTIGGYLEWGKFYEVVTVKFRTKDDAMMFKLAWA